MRNRFAGLAGGAMLCLAVPAHAHYVGDYAVGATVCRFFGTSQPTTGASFALAGTPTVEVYKDGSDTEDTDDSGATLTASVDSVAGQNRICVDTSADGTFYSADSIYSVTLEAGTVDGVSVVGQPIMSFSLAKSAAAAATAALNDFDPAADGVRVTHWNGVALATTNPLPNAAADAAGGLPISDAGGLDLDAILDAAISSRMATFTLPTNFSSFAITAGGAVTAGTVSDKSGYSLTQSFPTNFSSLDISVTGGVGLDWGNVQNPTTTVGLTGTTIDLVPGAVDDAALNSASELTGHATSALNTYDPPTRAEATADKAEIQQMLGKRTTVSALSSQTEFTPTAAPTSDAQLPGWGVLLIDAGDPNAYSLRKVVSASSGEITINKAADFTLATTDIVVFLPAFTNEPAETAFVYCEVNTANFAGDTDQLACILTDRDGAAVTAASGDLTGLELRVTSGAQIYEGRFINSTTWDAGNSELQLTLSRALPATLADGVTAIIR